MHEKIPSTAIFICWSECLQAETVNCETGNYLNSNSRLLKYTPNPQENPCSKKPGLSTTFPYPLLGIHIISQDSVTPRVCLKHFRCDIRVQLGIFCFITSLSTPLHELHLKNAELP